MSSTIPIPVANLVASLGANPEVAKEIQNLLLPDYDVVHMCIDSTTASTELPALCSGNTDTAPASGLGSNAGKPAAERKVPKAVIFGGGVTDEQAQAVSQAVSAVAPQIKTVRVTREDIMAAGATGPNPEVIVKVLREKLGALVERGEL
ncbi:hypothetical protein C8A03DRAFT_35194 [Achaetomium macrosporum]|uniref:Uncharacterized protein n=1 Tax=Achaetomium macrosporum TaxID=79813 RepID=A0AAN7HB07_9PEZI|nr:hypothetical protein C8A03DRAFT_35194 [Achaetomium macrosporum]